MEMVAKQTNVVIGIFIKCNARSGRRPEPRHAGPTSFNREAELEPPSRVAGSDLGRVVFMNVCKKIK
jgi:hypothetical protein